MAVERVSGGSSLIDVLDRVLDKGIVIDAWVRISLVGIDLITVEARVVVASIDTSLKYSEAVGQVAPVSRPAAVEQQRKRRWSRSSRPPVLARVAPVDGDNQGGIGVRVHGQSRYAAYASAGYAHP